MTKAKDELREDLAQYAHEAWSGWMKYMFSKGEFDRAYNEKTDGSEDIWIMPAWAIERWQRQMNTPYSDLSEEEKKSDREEADKMLEIISYSKIGKYD